jgi:hypothetical protein
MVIEQIILSLNYLGFDPATLQTFTQHIYHSAISICKRVYINFAESHAYLPPVTKQFSSAMEEERQVVIPALST